MTVKGSKQRRMKVVPHRPGGQVIKYLLTLVVIVAASGLAYWFGLNEGQTPVAELLKEQEALQQGLHESEQVNAQLQQDFAKIRIDGEIDGKISQVAQQTITSLQEQVGQLNEELSFYKKMLLPNKMNEGLRIEQLDLFPGASDEVRYSLLLIHAAENHGYIQGSVQISLLGQEAGQKKQLPLSALGNGKEDTIPFRFRYFQNIGGKLILPAGFEPLEVIIVAESGGKNTQRLEKTFDWSLGGE